MAQLAIPAEPDDLTAAWLTDALRGGGLLADAAVSRATVQPLGEDRSFAGRVLRVQVEYDRAAPEAPRSMVVKLPAADPMMRRALTGLGWYEREIRFYEELAARSSIRTPARYYSAMEPEAARFVLVLEEVVTGAVGDQVHGASLPQAEAVVDEIARFQAGWWEHPDLDRMDWLPAGAVRASEGAEGWQNFYRRGWAFVREGMRDVLPAGIDAIGDGLGAVYAEIVRLSATSPRTMIHGDCRVDNVFFPADQSERPVVIDWQFVSRARGVYDMAYFLGTNMPPELRRAHERELLRRYHALATERDTTGYTFDRCLHDYRLAMLLAFGFWVQTAGAPTYPEAGHALRDAAIGRLATALVDLDAGDLLEAGVQAGP